MPTYILPCSVLRVGPTNTTASGFQFRELVVSDNDPKFPQTLPITFTRSRTKLLDAIRVGDELAIDIELRGREHLGRHYLSAEGWHVKRKAADGTMLEVKPPEKEPQPDLFGAPQPAARKAPAAQAPFAQVQAAPEQRQPAPFDRSRHYKNGELCTHGGRVYRAAVDADGQLSWDAVPGESPAGKVEPDDQVPF